MPSDFSWDELNKLLTTLGYDLVQKGKTSGSRAKYVHPIYPPILLHKPHPRPILKAYQMRAILILLKTEGLI